MHMNIEFKEVSVIDNYRQINQKDYLIKANIIFEEGKTYLIKGEEAKYLLGRLIFNFEVPTFGQIIVGDYEIKRGKRIKNIKKYRQNIAYLPQDYENKFNYKTVNNIFKEALYNYNYFKEKDNELVEYIIDKTGCYLDYKQELLKNINSIQKYKLYLASILIYDPKIIILEKVINDEKIMNYLNYLCKEKNRTIIYIGEYNLPVDKTYVINNKLINEVVK